MKIIYNKPPDHIYNACVEKFGVDFEQGIMFAYDGALYTKYVVPAFKLEHERTHIKQQLEYGSADKWWEKYLSDNEFRLEQEIEAYKAEMRWLRAHVKDREAIAHIRHQNTIDLSSSMYGNLIPYSIAYRILL